jgi:large subunit ribosomal protein L22
MEPLEVSYRYAKVAPRKARLVVDLVRGMSVNEALNTLRLTRKRTSAMVTKLLKSAVATASESDVEPEDLMVSKAWVNPGPMRKGWFARPRGMSARMRYRTSHIHLVVSSAPEEPEEEKPAKAEAKRA